MRKAALTFSATMAARGGAALGGVLLSLVVARIAGAEGLGRFAVFLSLLGAFAILARYGKDMLLIRAVAWAEGRARAGTSIALLRHGVLRVLVPALVLGGLASALLASGWLGAPFPGTVAMMPLALVLLTVLALVAGYAKGRSRPWLAPLFEIGGISLLAACLLGLFALNGVAEAETAITVAFLAALLGLIIIASLMIWVDKPHRLPLPRLDTDQISDLRAGQLDFTLIALAGFLTQAGSFLLAAPFLSETDLGLLRAAERLALLVSFSVLAINPVIAPGIVRLSRESDAAGLQRLTVKAVMASSGIAACVLVPLLIWPERSLTLMGAEFAPAVPYLRIMACAQFLAAAIGPLVMLLNMSGRERASMWINLANLFMALGLIPLSCLVYGPLGFSFAISILVILRVFLIATSLICGRIRRATQENTSPNETTSRHDL